MSTTRADALRARAGIFHPVSHAMAEAAIVLGLRHAIAPDEIRCRISARADSAGCRTRFHGAIISPDADIRSPYPTLPDAAELTATLEALGCAEVEIGAPGAVFGLTFPVQVDRFSRHDRVRLAALARATDGAPARPGETTQCPTPRR